MQIWLASLPPHLRAKVPEALDLDAFDAALESFSKEALAKGYRLHTGCWKGEDLPGLEGEVGADLRELPDQLRRIFFNPHVLWSRESADRWDAIVFVDGYGIVIARDALRSGLDLPPAGSRPIPTQPRCTSEDVQTCFLHRGDPMDPAFQSRPTLAFLLDQLQAMTQRPLRGMYADFHDAGMSVYHPILGLAHRVIGLEDRDNGSVPALVPTHGGGSLLWRVHWRKSRILDRRDGWVFFRCRGELLAADEALLATWPKIAGSRLG